MNVFEGVVEGADTRGFGRISCARLDQYYQGGVIVPPEEMRNVQRGDLVCFLVSTNQQGQAVASNVTRIHTQAAGSSQRVEKGYGGSHGKGHGQQQHDKGYSKGGKKGSSHGRYGSPERPQADRISGTIKSYSDEGGFGFIDSAEAREKFGTDGDVFVHKNQIRGFRQGDSVTFVAATNARGQPQASDLRAGTGAGAGGGPSAPASPGGLAPPTSTLAGYNQQGNGASNGGSGGGGGAGMAGATSGRGPIEAQRFVGKVKSYSDDQGYGFIYSPEVQKFCDVQLDLEGVRDTFLHKKWANEADLQANDLVVFSVTLKGKNPQAERCVRITADFDADRTRPLLGSAGEKKKKFAQYYDLEKAREGVEKGIFMRAQLRVNPGGQTPMAFLPFPVSKEKRPDALIKGIADRNRAMHGDIVIVQLYPRSEWVEKEDAFFGKPKKVGDETQSSAPPSVAGDNTPPPPTVDMWENPAVVDGVHADKIDIPEGKQPTAFVIAIDDNSRGWARPHIANMWAFRMKGDDAKPHTVGPKDNWIVARPVDKRYPWCIVTLTGEMKAQFGLDQKNGGTMDKYQMFPIVYEKWGDTDSLPRGKLRGDCIGKAGEVQTEVKMALIEAGMEQHEEPHSQEILDEVMQIVKNFDENIETIAKEPGRKDLRGKRIFTIDPATAKDLDDAIHIDIIDDEVAEFGVHIADVSTFVKPGSKIDDEAQKRTTSVYLVTHVLPMLPHALCNHLCSLNPREPKCSFTATFRVKRKTGELIPGSWRFTKSLMESVCRMAYEDVQDVLDGKDAEWAEKPMVTGGWAWEDIEKDLWDIYDICGKVRDRRFNGGALKIDKTKLIYRDMDDQGIPNSFATESHSASHWMIEELMLFANQVVGNHIFHCEFKEIAVLRNHEKPDGKKWEALAEFVDELGIEFDVRFFIEFLIFRHKNNYLIFFTKFCQTFLILRFFSFSVRVFVHYVSTSQTGIECRSSIRDHPKGQGEVRPASRPDPRAPRDERRHETRYLLPRRHRHRTAPFRVEFRFLHPFHVPHSSLPGCLGTFFCEQVIVSFLKSIFYI